MSSDGLKRLKVWVEAKELAIEIHKSVIPCLPEIEKYVLNQQLRRAVNSISANIAEGYGRYYYQDNVRFCYIARGSLEETISHVILSYELGYFTEEVYSRTITKTDRLVQLLNGYIAYLKRTKQGENGFQQNKTLKEDAPDYEITVFDETDLVE
jgi:four helix bundle protein